MKSTRSCAESPAHPRRPRSPLRPAGALAAAALVAATCPAQAEDEPIVVVVSGSRASLATAQGIKREKLEIVDAVVAEDIGKLPDFSVTDAIQRVTGVQVGRDRGDGANVAIRGLTQVETTLNGREIFTAGFGRNLDYADIPAELLAGIDVYKTSSAHHIEGGVGGLVDLRTRRPFDFGGFQAVATIRSIKGDLSDRRKEQYSLLISNRWKGTAVGEFGALLSLSLQDRAYREDWKTSGNPLQRSVAGQQAVVPNGTSESTSAGTRKRSGGAFALQWRPREDLDLYAEGSYTELRTVQDSYQFFANTAGATLDRAVVPPGASDAQQAFWRNAAVTTAGGARDTTDRNFQIAAGGKWMGRTTTVKADLSYTKSHNDLLYTAIVLNGASANLAQDLSDKLPATATSGVDLRSLGSYAGAGIWHASRPFDGELKAARIDVERNLMGDYIDSVSGGLRLARRHATDAPGQVGFYPAAVPAGNAAALVSANPYADFLPGSDSVRNYLAGNPDAARNLAGLRQALGIGAAVPSSNPLGTWDIVERTDSAYAMATLRAAHMPLDGNVGLRVIRTAESVAGYLGAPGSERPTANATHYVDRLPSANLRYELTDGLFLRGAASKTLTRPDFNQMSPSLTLNSVQLRGTAGNPALHPVRANNVDLAVERYFSKSSSLHLTLFAKKVDGFLITASRPETYDGAVYQVSRPSNANSANINGAEIGYQQFYDFLPGWLSGLGLQANYTHVDSDTLDNTLRQRVPLQNLSRDSFNLVGMYERGAVSARIAYNWRSRFLSSVAAYGNPGALTPVAIYTRAYGWLDASFRYRLNDKLTLSVEGTNLLRTVRRSYYDVESRPADAWINDRQIVLAASLRF